MKIYSEISWSYWKSILNQSKYLGFTQNTQQFFISRSSLFCHVTPTEWFVLKYFQNISGGMFPDSISEEKFHFLINFQFFFTYGFRQHQVTSHCMPRKIFQKLSSLYSIQWISRYCREQKPAPFIFYLTYTQTWYR